MLHARAFLIRALICGGTPRLAMYHEDFAVQLELLPRLSSYWCMRSQAILSLEKRTKASHPLTISRTVLSLQVQISFIAT